MFRVISAGALLLIAACMLAWRDIPLFYDEAAFSRYYGRAFIDGFLQYPFFPVCATPKMVPVVFMAPHMLLSWIDGWPHWTGTRLLPLASTAILVGVAALLIWQRSGSSSKKAWSLGILCGGFVGLGGVGLALWRWEFIATLHIAMCLVTWLIAQRDRSSAWLIAVTLTLHLAVIMLSLFVHLQGLLVMPLSFLTCARLLKGHPWLVAGVGISMALLGLQAAVYGQFRCPEDPAFEQVLAQTHGVILSNQLAEYSWVERAVRRLWHFERQFFFQHTEELSIPVPQLPKWVATVTIPPTAVVVALNLLGLLGGLAYACKLLWPDYGMALLRYRWRSLLALAQDGRSLWAAAAALLLFYSFYDIGGTFYRAHYRNFLSAVLLAIGASHALNTRWLRGWSLICLASCTAGTAAAWIFLAPQLAQGYESYYVSLRRDWPRFNERVRALASQCHIKPEDGRVLVDVATYDALRHFPRPIDYNYVWYTEYLKGALDKPRSEQEWLDYYRQFDTSGYVALCRTVDLAKMPVQHRDADLCCLRF